MNQHNNIGLLILGIIAIVAVAGLLSMQNGPSGLSFSREAIGECHRECRPDQVACVPETDFVTPREFERFTENGWTCEMYALTG